MRKAVNDLMDSDPPGRYVVTDFDNTAIVFDMEHQLLVWQIRNMAFAADPELFGRALRTGLEGEYGDWYADIENAYGHLWDAYGPFTGDMLPETEIRRIREDPWWREFAVKLRAFFALVNPNEGKSAVWILCLFAGMTPDQVYDLAYASHRYYSQVESARMEMSSEMEDTRLGIVECQWISGISMTAGARDLWETLYGSGFAIWACSASG